MMNLLQELKFKVSKLVRLMIDNKFFLSLAKNPMLDGRNKHIDTKYHFLHNQVQNGVLEVVHVSIQKQLADVLTKVIKTEHFIILRYVIGVVDFNLNVNQGMVLNVINSTFKISFICIYIYICF